jgi:Protein of unknown function (DUF4239)
MSIINWISDLPTTAAMVIALCAGGTLSALGCLGAQRLLPQSVRSSHNEVAGYILGIVGGIYAVLLAFIAVAAWQNFGQAEHLVQTEANLVGDLYRDTIAFPEPAASRMRHYLFVYAVSVVQDEWPALATGRADEAAGWQLLDQVHSEVTNLHAREDGIAVMQAEAVRTLNALSDARRGRFDAATANMPPILWWNLIGGAVILMLFTYLFRTSHLPMHTCMISLLGAFIGLVLVMIVLLDNPFRAQSHVSVQPFSRLVIAVNAMAYPHR